MGSAIQQGDLWGRRARDWASQELRHAPLWEALFDAAGVTSGTRLLDAGCGAGGAAAMAVARGARVTGLDASRPLIEVARERVPGAVLHVGDIEEMPFADDSFDAVTAANSVQYAADPLGAMEELARVAIPGAAVAVGLFAPPDLVEYDAVIASTIRAVGDPIAPGKGPYALSDPGRIESLMTDAGLDVANVGEVECPFEYESFDALWAIHLSAGPTQAALAKVGEDELRAVVSEAVTPFTSADGSLHFANTFRWVVGLVPG